MTPTGSRSRSSGRSDVRWSQLRAGASILVVLVVATTVVFLSDVIARELSEGPRLTVTAAEARGLEPGSAVWVAGVPAGRVTSLRFRDPARSTDRPVLIRAVLRGDAAGMLREDASADIRASSLLAPSVVAVRPGRSDRAFDFADKLRAEPRLDREDLMARLDTLAGSLRSARPLADSLRRRLAEGPGTLASLRRDEGLREELGRAARRAGGLAERLPRGTVARLAADTAIRASLGRISTAAEVLASGGRRAGAQRDSLRRRLERVTERLDDLGRGLEAGRGTAGRLLHDPALRRERALLEARMDSVRAELLADPLRWLRVRLF